MKQVYVVVSAMLLSFCSLSLQAQQTVATNTNVIVPPLVSFSGVLTGVDRKPLNGVVGVTFLLYQDQQGGAPLWMETQNVEPDSRGHYTVMLGSTSSTGLPADIFVAGQAHWLGVQAEGQQEQPRVLLVSAPYALKAGDAQTLGGLPASAFVLAAPPNGAATSTAAAASTSAAATGSISSDATSDVTTTGGRVNALPLFSTATNIQNSLITQTATTAINVGGKLNLPATGTASASAGRNSHPQDFVASAFDSSTSVAVPQTFQLQAEPAGNDTTTPSGTLNLLYASGTATPAETGMGISSQGIITFATGQMFPGAAVQGAVPTASNALELGGLAPAAFQPAGSYATLGANTFTGNQTVSGNMSVTGAVTGSGFDLGGNAFAFGSLFNTNAFLGFAGNATMTGVHNTAVGAGALDSNTTGTENTASGINALESNTSGGNNTASGGTSLFYNTSGSGNTASGALSGTNAAGGAMTGSNNTFLGYLTKLSKGNLNNATVIGANASAMGNNATAIGANAQVSSNNALVLGSINGVNGATASTFVGIGTTAPSAALDVLGESTVHTLIGDGGCGSSYAGIGFIGSGGFDDNCVNYALLGENNGNLYINSNGGGTIYFRNQNNPSNLMTIDNNGTVTIANLNVTNSLSKPGGSFKIDHPLDPANKYLYHSFVESPDMMNVYNGNVVTDQRGLATVILPDYFEALNRDFRYQLTVIGQFAQAIVAEEIAGNRFVIRTSKPSVKVSWQVTGIRHDAYADAHRIQVEVEKPPQEQGHYLHPELFGASEERAVGYPPPRVNAGNQAAAALPIANLSQR
jgi:trimeric autotransporter adhesin